MIVLMFLGYGKPASNMVVIMARAHISQPKIVHPFVIYTFDMSIASIGHLDSWGVAPPISVYEIRVSEHCSNNDVYVIKSMVMMLFK